MRIKLLAALFIAAITLLGCASDGTEPQDTHDGSISFKLPEIGTRGALLGESEITTYILKITSDEIDYSNTIKTKTGGIVSVEKLAEARYEIAVDALDDDGDVILTGFNHAYVYIGEVTYAQIELNYTFGHLDIALTLPGQDRLATLDIEGIKLDGSEPIRVVHGPGIFIERLNGGLFAYAPGLASMKVFSIETGGDNATTLQSWFDGVPTKLSASLIVKDLAGKESYRWNILELSPLFYEKGADSQTQFYFSVYRYEASQFDASLPANYNQDTDKGIEIEGVTPSEMAVAVRENDGDNTLTMVFGHEAGLREVYDWIMDFVAGRTDRRAMSVITFGAGGFGDEVSRRNYYEIFPISFEQINGFQYDIKGRFRMVLSYEFFEDV